jgi:hypothetical protein
VTTRHPGFEHALPVLVREHRAEVHGLEFKRIRTYDISIGGLQDSAFTIWFED